MSRRHPQTCPHCDYDLSTLASDTPCPECGILRTAKPTRPREGVRAAAQLLLAFIAVPALVVVATGMLTLIGGIVYFVWFA